MDSQHVRKNPEKIAGKSAVTFRALAVNNIRL